MKTKLIITASTLWVILAALNEAGLIDAIPIENENLKDWVKWIVAVILVIANMIWVKPEVAKRIIKSIGGGGIKPPKK